MKSIISEDKSIGQFNQTNAATANNQINWNHFNYPCCLKLFNYERDKIPEMFQRQVRLLWLTHVLIWTVTLLNLLTNIIAAGQGYDGVRIGISVFLILFWWPLGLFLFYQPYVILLKGEGRKWLYYLLAGCTFLFFSIWSIADFADANGFVRVDQYFNQTKAASGVFGLFTSLISLVIVFLIVIDIFLIQRNT